MPIEIKSDRDYLEVKKMVDYYLYLIDDLNYSLYKYELTQKENKEFLHQLLSNVRISYEPRT